MLNEKLSKMTQEELINAYVTTLNWVHPNREKVLKAISLYLPPYYEGHYELTFNNPF